MVTLRFIAREDALATVPGSRANVGQPAFYIGRKYIAPDRAAGRGARYEATQEPYEVTLDLDRQDDAMRFNRHVKLAQRGDIWPADEETAKHCGLAFVQASFANGEWKRSEPMPPQPPNDVMSSAPSLPATALHAEPAPEQQAARDATPFGLQPPQDVFADAFADVEVPREKPTKKRP
jgi:hypothetical protein